MGKTLRRRDVYVCILYVIGGWTGRGRFLEAGEIDSGKPRARMNPDVISDRIADSEANLAR
jgi:hypothetical protein